MTPTKAEAEKKAFESTHEHGGKKTTLNVLKVYKDGGIVGKEEADEETIEVNSYPKGVPVAEVSFGCRMTLNLGNYQTIQVSADVKLPCCVEELNDAYSAAKKFVDKRMNKEVREIREYKKEKTEGKETDE